MTVSYNLDVSSVSAFSFCKLLFHWKGSIWKSVYVELSIWLASFYVVFGIAENFIDTESKRKFDLLAVRWDKQLEYIPLTFMLGFFVSIIVSRWRGAFLNMGWIENCALTLATLLPSNDPIAVLEKRTVIRYLVLSQILVFRDISMRVRRRFPNMEALVKAGFIHDDEIADIEKVSCDYNKYWVPIRWALSICAIAHKEGRIVAPPSLNNIISEIRTFRTCLAHLCNFDWVPIPIAYPQVVFFAVRAYFAICLVSRQYVEAEDLPKKFESWIVRNVPFMTILQFIFVLGWVKVAEALLNPLGDDDDDFECNFLIDKNIATGLAIVDQCHSNYPKLRPDKFSNRDYTPVYSEESTKTGVDAALLGSVQGITLAEPTEKVKMVAVRKMSVVSQIEERIHSRSATERLKRKLTNIRKSKRSRTMAPVELGLNLPPNRSTVPQRAVPASPTSLANYDLGNFDKNILPQVEEEKENSSTLSSKSSLESPLKPGEDENKEPEVRNRTAQLPHEDMPSDTHY